MIDWNAVWGPLLVTCIAAAGSGIWVYVRMTDKHKLLLEGPMPPGAMTRIEKLEERVTALELAQAERDGYDRRHA